MGTSGNPAVRAGLAPSSAQDFKKRRAGLFELPSGLVMRLRNPGGLKIFMKEGLIPNSLMGTVQNALDKGKEMEAKDFVKDGKVDPLLMDNMMALLDAVMVECAVQPRVYPSPSEADVLVWNSEHEDEQVNLPELLKDDEKVYADEIDDQDKMFVFQWITGGTSDLESFRREHATNVADLSRSAEVAVPAKRASRAAKK